LVGSGWYRRTPCLIAAFSCTIALVADAAPQAEAEPPVEVQAVRFYRSGSAQTLVDVFCRVPLAHLGALVGRGDSAGYRIAVSVRDSTGLALLPAQVWSQTVGAALLALPWASTVEHLEFAAKPGRYTVDVTVTDSASGRTSQGRVEVRTFAAAPGASDLLLASSLRPGAGAGTPRAGEFRKGALLIETGGRPRLTPQRSDLGYYLELYPQRAESATVTARVRSTQGSQIVATAPQRLAVGAEGGATDGVVDLGGLPPGPYRLEVMVTTPDSEVVRSAEFIMAGFEADVATALSAAPPSDKFATLSEADLDSLYVPLVYLMAPGEQGVYSGLTVEGKRAFLRKFWVSRNPTPGRPANEFEDRFYRLIAEANQRFREGGKALVPGWRTDRGRIFIKYGVPDEVLDRNQAGSTRPYIVWKYTRGRTRKFIFLDLSSFGNYQLIWTNESRETSRPNWDQLLGSEAVNDAMRF
jgi:GWxTD domain-containing protein